MNETAREITQTVTIPALKEAERSQLYEVETYSVNVWKTYEGLRLVPETPARV
jgi:hypothetical protein